MPPESRVSMLDIARAVGLHQTTVSLALRHHPRIPEATRRKILAAAERLGYRPNPLVSALMASRRRRGRGEVQAVIGYVSGDPPDVGGGPINLGYKDLFDGASARAAALGYRLENFWIGDPKMTRARFNRITATRGIHGLLIAPLSRKTPTLELDWDRFSSVAYGYSLTSPEVHRILPDFYHSMQTALHRCLEAGFKRPGLVLATNVDRKADHLWLSAYLGEQHVNRKLGKVPPLLLPKIDVESLANWARRHRVEAVITIDSPPFNRTWTPDGQVKADGRALPLVLLNLGANGGPVPGIFIDREEVGAICIDVLVSLLHRTEKGPPRKAQHVLVKCDWWAPPGWLRHPGKRD